MTMHSADDTVTLRELVAGWLRGARRPADTVWHLAGALDAVGISVEHDVLETVHKESLYSGAKR